MMNFFGKPSWKVSYANRFFERNDLGIEQRSQVRHPVPQNRVHELLIVAHDRTLPRVIDGDLTHAPGKLSAIFPSLLSGVGAPGSKFV
jgi:hypothetical protein